MISVQTKFMNILVHNFPPPTNVLNSDDNIKNKANNQLTITKLFISR